MPPSRPVWLTLFGVLLAALPLAGAAQRPDCQAISILVTDGVVVTRDAARRVLNPGAIAIDGADSAPDDVQSIINGRVVMRERRILTLDEPRGLGEARGMAETVR